MLDTTHKSPAYARRWTVRQTWTAAKFYEISSRHTQLQLFQTAVSNASR